MHFKLIITLIEDHKTDAVVDAARTAGATGATVLNQARRSVSRKPIRPWNFGWIHALSTVAIVVLGLALVMQLPEPPPQEPLRIAKPPSGKLRNPAADSKPLRLPAPEAAEPTAAQGMGVWYIPRPVFTPRRRKAPLRGMRGGRFF